MSCLAATSSEFSPGLTSPRFSQSFTSVNFTAEFAVDVLVLVEGWQEARAELHKSCVAGVEGGVKVSGSGAGRWVVGWRVTQRSRDRLSDQREEGGLGPA